MVNRGAGKSMDLGKKGIFFTSMTIIILSLFFISYAAYSEYNDRKPIEKRIDTMNKFLFSLETDLSRQIYISGFYSVFIIEKDIVETGNYNPNVTRSFQELFVNGSINGKDQPFMLGAKISDIQQAVSAKGQKINVNVTINASQPVIDQVDPWHIRIQLPINLSVEDSSKLASWNKMYTVTAFVPVEGFEDPLYVVNTFGLVPNNITKTPYYPFVQGSNVGNLSQHLQYSLYYADSLAPSFLDRLEGKLSANPNGIESFVYIPKLSSQGITVTDKSDIDYIYFSGSSPSIYHVSGMPSWFRIDDSHLSLYNVSGLTSP
ncbi:hypothetical protein KW787_01925 [Candidatus Pacearchaeota archaeon]|nr:hypothetical protein [Candidatus Pacearchaeota archaeon]